MAIGIIAGVLVAAVIFALLTFNRLICICQPNEVLIFSGTKRRIGDREIGYQHLIGGRRLRIPLLERVDRMDLTNMVIDVTAHNAYSKGGIPLTVQGVANIKVASFEPVLNNAIERFLGRSRADIIGIARATLEGSLRGILATMTPEQVNEDKNLFAERLMNEAEHDLTNLGLTIDTLKIQNVSDDVGYLDSLGRKTNAAIVKRARIAEASAKADAVVRSAENREREVASQIDAHITVAKAEAQKRLTDALTRRAAVVAEEQASVSAAVAQATAEIDVQKARIEQVKRRLEADIIKPARAALEATENAAKGAAAPIIEQGKAKAEVLRTLAEAWKIAGENARNVFLLQKLDSVVHTVTSTIADTKIDKVTIIDSRASGLGDGTGSLPQRALTTLEQVKEVFGIDLVEKLRGIGPQPPGVPQRSIAPAAKPNPAPGSGSPRG